MTSAQLVLETYFKWVDAVYGPDETLALRAVAGDEERVLLEPQTCLAEMGVAIADLQARRPLTEDQYARGLPLLVEAKKLLASPSEYDERLVETEPGASFLAFLHDAQDRLGARVFLSEADPINALGWHTLLVPGLDRYLKPVATGFEASSKVVALALWQGVEAMYKPMLRAALAMTPTRKGNPLRLRSNVPDEVGKIAQDCRAGWTGTGGPLGALDDDLVLARNSIAHSATKYDVVNKTVTFVNKKADGSIKLLGPLDGPALAALSKRLYDLIATLALAYQRATTRARGLSRR